MARKKQTGVISKSIIAILLLAVCFIAFKFIGPAAHKPEKEFLYVRTGTDMNAVKQQILGEDILSSLTWFNITSRILGFKTVKPGRYQVDNGMSVLNLVRNLKNGSQSPVKFTITKLRTKEALAGKIGKAFECDSLAAISFLNNNDSLKTYGLDSNTVMAMAMPLTYEAKWNISVRNILDKFYDAYNIFWTKERKQKAANQGLTPLEVVTLASIIDEETNFPADKPKIASTYMNRMQRGMPLQADPTIKFALKDFSITRIMFKHLDVKSPYNTYRNKGLPPGPICTPQQETIEAVLNAPKTDYLYFVASSNFDGTHIFTSNYEDHMRYATAYQQALNERMADKLATDETP